MRASTTLTVGGVSLTRASGTAAPGHANSDDAIKHWVVTPNPGISITKNVKEQTIASGANAPFTIVVTNTGNVTLTNVRVADALSPDCSKTSSAIAGLAQMEPGASITYTCSAANVTASFTNVAIATGTPPSGPDVTATDSAHVTVTQTPPPTNPGISITKNVKEQTIASGATAPFTIVVTNTGDVTLTNVRVTDALSPDCSKTSADLAGLASMAPGATVTYRLHPAERDGELHEQRDRDGHPAGPART